MHEELRSSMKIYKLLDRNTLCTVVSTRTTFILGPEQSPKRKHSSLHHYWKNRVEDHGAYDDLTQLCEPNGVKIWNLSMSEEKGALLLHVSITEHQ